MKKPNFLTILGLITFTIIFIASCNRKEVSSLSVADNSTKDMLISYLTQQKTADASAGSFIDTLISKSNWDDISQLSISKDVRLIYVPLNYNSNNTGMTFLYNNNSQKVFYSQVTELPINDKSNIVHTTSNNLNRPIDVIKGFYNYNLNGYNGSIRAYSLSNNFLWEYGYENGKQKYEKWITSSTNAQSSSGVSQIKSSSIDPKSIKANGCLDWYNVTWYDDGSSDWHYIGTTCDGNCPTSIGITQDSLRIKSNCNSSGGGIGGDSYLTYKIISNNITDPCLKQLISNLQNSNKLTNAIGAIMQNVFGINNEVNLIFNQKDNLVNKFGVSVDAQSYPTNGVGNNFNIDIDATALKKYSQERKILTIMHEVLHTFLSYEYNNSFKLSLPNQHTTILNNYIDQMASSLGNLFPEMKAHPDVALALTFDCLQSSVGTDLLNKGQILLDDFQMSIMTHGLNIGTWQSLANLAKTNDISKSPYVTQTPCGNNTKQN